MMVDSAPLLLAGGPALLTQPGPLHSRGHFAGVPEGNDR